MQNVKVRVEMAKQGMKQKDLADCLGITEPELSIMLRNELSSNKQKEIIEKIREYKKGE